MEQKVSQTDHWTWSHKNISKEVRIFGAEQKRVMIHPHWSDGTAGVRGTRILNRSYSSLIYWEIRLPHRIFGTSLMFGIGTTKCRLHSNNFTNLLGEDGSSWGLSHKGLIWHNGVSRKFCKPFLENQSTTIGLMFDSLEGTLTYYKDGVELGVAFRGLNCIKEKLYPVVSSTAAKTVMILCNLKMGYQCLSLKARSRYEILRNLSSFQDISMLPLPKQLKTYLNDSPSVFSDHGVDGCDNDSQSSLLKNIPDKPVLNDAAISESLLEKIYSLPDHVISEACKQSDCSLVTSPSSTRSFSTYLFL